MTVHLVHVVGQGNVKVFSTHFVNGINRRIHFLRWIPDPVLDRIRILAGSEVRIRSKPDRIPKTSCTLRPSGNKSYLPVEVWLEIYFWFKRADCSEMLLVRGARLLV